ncbi:MAG: hypothetical protein PHP08_00680 [Candidatus Dojkabacteria bacterium]|nr:hypothetical protein [Candidatus Dojkabacteria bacterium]
MNKGIEIENNKIDFKYLYRITDIEIDKVTFIKYEINPPTTSISNSSKSVITLGNIEGREIYICKPDVIYEIAGKVGSVIKGFEVDILGKSRKKVLVSKIIWME